MVAVAQDYDSQAIIEFLVKCGADVDAKNDDGKSALMIARENGNTMAEKALIEAGAAEA